MQSLRADRSFLRTCHVAQQCHRRPVRIVSAAQPTGLRRSRKSTATDPTPYFEPLLRSFLLGLGASAIFESGHVVSKFAALTTEVGMQKVSEVLPQVVDRFSPLFVGDHIVAMCSWMLFYMIEAAAVWSVVKEFPDNPDAAADALRKMVTLPKKMLPLRLAVFKQLLLRGGMFAPAAAGAGGGGAGKAAAAAQASAFRGGEDGGTATLERAVPTERPAGFGRGAPQPEGPEGGNDDEDEKPVRSGKHMREAANIVMAPQPLDHPVTKPSRGKDGVPLARPINKRTLDRQRQEKGLKPGEWDPNSSLLANRVKELQGRRAYLKNFWYAAGISEQVKDKPVGVTICGERVVLFRGKDGQVCCLNDICPHRGAPFSEGGKVVTVNGRECVECPYHGWTFDGEGVLRSVPAAENAGEWPERPLIDAYPVAEKGGFIWLFYGSKDLPVDERPPIPYVPELDDPSWRPVYGDIEFDCNHWSVFENAIDMAHIHYLHSDSFGNQSAPQIRDMHCGHDAYGVKASFKLHNKPVNKLWEFSQVPVVEVTAQALLPSTSVIAFTLGNGLSFTTFVNTVPIDEHRTVNRFALVRRLSSDKTGVFNWAAWDGFARQAMLKILGQDKAMVEQLRPELLPREISVKADLPQIAFRKLRQEYIDMGYGVDPVSSERRFSQPTRDM